MLRAPGRAAAAESWHRDVAAAAAAGDDVFGGWLNLDAVASEFVCCPGTHGDDAADAAGFAPLGDAKAWAARSATVAVPPGHLLVFFETIAHRVASRRAPPAGVVRLFAGWRLTASDAPLMGAGALASVLADQAVPLLKSGQTPALYPVLYWTNHRRLLPPLAMRFREELRVVRTLKRKRGDDRPEERVVCPPRHAASLRACGLPLYPAYDDDEVALLTPQPPDDDDVVAVVTQDAE